MAHQLSEGAKQALEEYAAKDAEFLKAWEEFERSHEKELIVLEILREARNAALDSATRALREEADSPSCEDKSIRAGVFTATKKVSKSFHPDMTLARIEEADLLEEAKKVGAVEISTTIKYNEMKQFLLDKKIYPDFEDCEDEQKLTTAISGPKPIASFGGEIKKR